MVNIITEEIEIEESLESRLRVICDFCNTMPIIINGSIRRIDKTNLTYIEPHRIYMEALKNNKNIKDLELLQQQLNNGKLLIENK